VIPVLVAVNRTNPDHVIQGIQTKLAGGRSVTLIGETGKPNWFRWRCGEKASHLTLADDRTCNINSWPISLLELLSDTQSESYRITAQVRHDTSDTAGEVGIYFAHKAYPGRPSDLQFFAQLTFNAVRGEADFRARLPDEIKFSRPPRDNAVHLIPHLVSGESVQTQFSRRLIGTNGPLFKPLGEYNGRWHDLEVTVTPASVTARWDGQPFSTATSGIQENINTDLTLFPPTPSGPLRPGFVPEFRARGGLGLYVWRGSASFRSVKVTPL
jgi:serine/threonine-protein kinase